MAEFSYRLQLTWDYVEDHLTVWQINAYRSFWNREPPVDVLAAGYLGFKPKTSVSSDAAIEAVAGYFGGIPG